LLPKAYVLCNDPDDALAYSCIRIIETCTFRKDKCSALGAGVSVQLQMIFFLL
jgi:hypothetical protein